MNKLYLKLKFATIAMVFALIVVGINVFGAVSNVSAQTTINEPIQKIIQNTSPISVPTDTYTVFEQLCLADHIEYSEDALMGYVIGVPDNTTRFRLLRAYPELTFRVFNAEQGLIGRPLADVIAADALYVWWCSAEQAAQHVSQGRRVLQLSRPIVSSISLSNEVLSDYFYSNAELISLRPEEIERLAAVGTIQIGLPDDSSPIISRDNNGNPIGLDHDFITLIAQRLNLRVAWVNCGGWQECVQALEARDIDALTFMTPTPSRLLFSQFTVPYWQVDWALMSLENRPIRLDDFSTEKQLTIAVLASYSILETADAAENVTVLAVNSPEEGLNAVLEGRADAYLDSLPLLMNRIRELNLTGAVVHIARDLQGDQVSIGVRSDWAAIVPLLDRSILAITDDETRRIEENWFDPELLREGLNREVVKRWAVIMAIAVLLVLSVILAWMSHLRREIQRRKIREAEIRYKAYHDELTGLPNRMHVIEKAQKTLITHAQNKRKCALLFIDLDGFKAINDNEGHDAGDELLVAVSQRLQRVIRKTDTVARYGGDEFVILVTSLTSVKQALNIAEKVLSRVSMPYRLATGEAKIGASIGVAIFPDHGHEYDELLSAADDAMYAVKESGKNGVVLAEVRSAD
ncbi:diguanylate cyclase (GGDEF) domain-containing protein [Idiomarina sp. A28L]|uniref:diguanylate cyclase domain-containing protein n=1 Tax=Idiomarina sp. A28L TaxID=1036674 RepID=UPI0002138D59|nr:diguanylate cyclase [Idiomarina sp. A28L]EGN74662.1 diguanylate cyclase (GGDEF) domain-containing protein [Idiomarina sp. A28L]